MKCLSTKDEIAAAVALLAWLDSQEIDPASAIPVMCRAIVGLLPVLARDDRATIKDMSRLVCGRIDSVNRDGGNHA